MVGIPTAAAADERDDIDPGEILDLVGRAGARLGGVEPTLPSLSGPGLPETVLAGGRLRIGDPEEAADPASARPEHLAGLDGPLDGAFASLVMVHPGCLAAQAGGP